MAPGAELQLWPSTRRRPGFDVALHRAQRACLLCRPQRAMINRVARWRGRAEERRKARWLVRRQPRRACRRGRFGHNDSPRETYPLLLIKFTADGVLAQISLRCIDRLSPRPSAERDCHSVCGLTHEALRKYKNNDPIPGVGQIRQCQTRNQASAMMECANSSHQAGISLSHVRSALLISRLVRNEWKNYSAFDNSDYCGGALQTWFTLELNFLDRRVRQSILRPNCLQWCHRYAGLILDID